MKRRRKDLSLFTLVMLLATFFTFSQPPLVRSQSAITYPQRGMCYVTWDRNRFASEHSDASIEKLSELGVEYLSVVITWYQDSHDSTEIRRTDRSPTDRSIRHVVRKAKSMGQRVMLKPHVDLEDKYDGTFWRGDIGFHNEADWDKWFESYTRYILRYARLAERWDVEIFCVGTELAFTTQKTERWRELIEKVREVYSGRLVYAANWDEYRHVHFWEDLDYVGIDAYFPLSYSSSPSLSELKQGWQRWINEIERWLPSVNNMKVIFTELGYASTPTAPSSPWQGGTYGNADPETQAKCYQAFFETVWHKPWFAGVYWWKWETNTRAGGIYNRQFTPQNKPAEKLIKTAYTSPHGTETSLAMKQEK